MLDRERRLRYPLAVLRDLEGEADLARMLYAGLKHEDPDLTVEQVAEMVDLEMLEDLTEPLKRATGGMVDLSSVLGSVAEADDETDEDAEGNGAAES